MRILQSAYRGTLGAWMVCILLTGMVYGQGPADTTQSDADEGVVERNVELSGSVGAYGQLYTISGRDARRPSSTGRLFLRPSITFLNELTVNFNILLSNEGVSARQSINQIGLDPSWSWGDAHIGDFSESFSNYTLNGITIRGGGVNLYPGSFRFSAVAGRAQRAVSGGAGNKSYSRTIYGAKLGIGKQSGSFLDLIVVRAMDDVGSLPADSLLTNPGAIYSDTTDTTVVGNAPPVNPYAVTPQENLVGGVNWQLEVVPDRLTWQSEVSGSFFTRDLRSAEIDFSDLNAPSIAEGLYTPRYSTNADFIVDSKLNLNLSRFSAEAGYKWIGPGYRSLGTSYLISDQQEFSSRVSYRFSRASVSFNWASVNDNLLDQKQFTSVQNRYGGTITARFSNSWNSNLTANIISRGNDSDNDTTRASFNNLVLSSSQSFTFSESPVFQNLSLNYTYQRAHNESGLQFENTSRTHTVNSGLSLRFMENLSSNASFGFVSSQTSDTLTRTTTTLGAGLRHQAFENKWSNSLSFSSSFRSNNTSLRTRLSSSYKLTDKSQLSLSLSYTNFKGRQGLGADFNEFTGSLRISHRF